MARRYGRGPRDQRLRVGIPHGHGKTSPFVAGLRTTALVAPFVLDGPINRAAFETSVAKDLGPELRRGDVVVMDNLSSHKGPRVRKMIEAADASLLYLPSDSPNRRTASATSIRSRTPLRSGRRSCARPPSAPSRASGLRSAASSKPSRQTNAPTPSLQQDTMQRERIPLYYYSRDLLLQPGFVRCLGREVSSHDACKRCPSLGRSVG